MYRIMIQTDDKFTFDHSVLRECPGVRHLFEQPDWHVFYFEHLDNAEYIHDSIIDPHDKAYYLKMMLRGYYKSKKKDPREEDKIKFVPLHCYGGKQLHVDIVDCDDEIRRMQSHLDFLKGFKNET